MIELMKIVEKMLEDYQKLEKELVINDSPCNRVSAPRGTDIRGMTKYHDGGW